MKKPYRHWRKVTSPSNSECSAKLSDLDFSKWWTDNSFAVFYLHVPHKHDDTIHRVYCKHTDNARLGFASGVLYWIVPK